MFYSRPIQRLLWGSGSSSSQIASDSFITRRRALPSPPLCRLRENLSHMSDRKASASFFFFFSSLPTRIHASGGVGKKKKLTPASRAHVSPIIIINIITTTSSAEMKDAHRLTMRSCWVFFYLFFLFHVPAASFPPARAWRRSSRCRGRAEVPERYCGSPRHPC